MRYFRNARRLLINQVARSRFFSGFFVMIKLNRSSICRSLIEGLQWCAFYDMEVSIEFSYSLV
jgi:hypothetical protein